MYILLYFYKECCTLFRHAVRLLSIIFILSRFAFTCFIRAGPEQSWILGLISAGCYWGIYIMSYMLQGLSILEDENMNYSQLWMSTRIIWLYKSRDKWSVLKEILHYFFDNFLPLHFLCSLSSGTLVNQILKFWEWLFNFFCIASSIFHLLIFLPYILQDFFNLISQSNTWVFELFDH